MGCLQADAALLRSHYLCALAVLRPDLLASEAVVQAVIGSAAAA